MSDLGKQKRKILLYLLIIYCLNSIASGVGPNEVIVYSDPNFSGNSQSWTLDSGMRHRSLWKVDYWKEDWYDLEKPTHYGNVKNDKISSIEVGSDVNVVVFRHSCFSGPYTIFEYPTKYVGNYWNDAISSLIIFPKGQAYPLGVMLTEEAPYTILGGLNPELASQFFPLPEYLKDKETIYDEFEPICVGYTTICDKYNDVLPFSDGLNEGYLTIKGDNIEAELFQAILCHPEDSFLVLPTKTNICSGAEGEYNGNKFYRPWGCVQKNARSMIVRWIGPDATPKERSTAVGTSAGGFISEPAGDQENPVTTSTNGGTPRIVSISWQPNNKAIQVIFDQFPASLWNEQWEMYIDNNKMPVATPQGSPNVRPNAELDKNPTGVFIGSLPWLSGLNAADFPCCGAIKFCIPGGGCTNEVDFNLAGDGCKTASQKNC